MEQRGKERGALVAWKLLSTKWVSYEIESIMVRSEERSIYTPRENPTVQIYVGSPDADPGTSDVSRKYYSEWVRSPRVKVSVETPEKRRDFRRAQLNKQPAPLMPGLPVWVRSVSELPENIGTSDCRNSR